MKLEFSWQIFEKYSNIKFHENPFSGSQVIPRVTDRGTDMTKVIVAFRNFAKKSLKANRQQSVTSTHTQQQRYKFLLQLSELQQTVAE
jgi:hypothetical protein